MAKMDGWIDKKDAGRETGRKKKKEGGSSHIETKYIAQ